MTRIKGISGKEKERSNEVLDQVKKKYLRRKELLTMSAKSSPCQQKIPRRYRHRTLFYRKRKTLKGKSMHLDLTKSIKNCSMMQRI